ncbi:putative DNA modification/repair radical SAM protein [Acidovorax sp. PRC11]|nr:putative DNA modification/repair radical SAM protein [Acidovorax sp. PRC11]MDT0136850.1 putative DNA modification/repair radical SAM protein [Acidovorax sp. PRC11]
MNTTSKLAILADAAKYDASCASSGTSARNSVGGRGIGSTEGMGICHSYAPDGRCISLLKILLTNYCQYDCLYCVNRVSSNVPRARFAVREVVDLTLDFYRRNCIEGLFLSSGIIQSPDYTMERVVEVARSLREDHDFRGYIHLKTIPDAAPELLERAGRYADRLSINIELPTSEGLATLAPEKDGAAIQRSMGRLALHIDEARQARVQQQGARPGDAQIISLPGRVRRAEAPRFAPGGQSTQMIVGADGADDRTILAASSRLYGGYGLRRVYYSAFSPIPDASRALPLAAPPLVREHRLYQADWLMRFYGFTHDEIVPPAPAAETAGGDGSGSGMLSLDMDPKLAWAIAHPEHFPVDLNTAARERLLRVPGLGVRTVERLLAARRVRRLCHADLGRLHVPLGRVLPFVAVADHRPADRLRDPVRLRARLTSPVQASLFA